LRHRLLRRITFISLFQFSRDAACAELVSASLQRSLFDQANQNLLIKEQSVEECDARKAS
jgi:hypothetical protein